MNPLQDFLDLLAGKYWFEVSGSIWEELMSLTKKILLISPSGSTYKEAWVSVKGVYNTMTVIATALLVVFFLYGFLRDSMDLRQDITMDKAIKLFIRLIIVANVMSLALSWMPRFFSWAQDIVQAIVGESNFAFTFDGASIYQDIADADNGALFAWIFSIGFFIVTAYCGITTCLTVVTRILKIYMIAPFSGIALSTLAAGGQISNVGYSYIKTFFGYVCSAFVIAIVLIISGKFIDAVSLDTSNAVVKAVIYMIKMTAITTSIKSADTVMQKAFGL